MCALQNDIDMLSTIEASLITKQYSYNPTLFFGDIGSLGACPLPTATSSSH